MANELLAIETLAKVHPAGYCLRPIESEFFSLENATGLDRVDAAASFDSAQYDSGAHPDVGALRSGFFSSLLVRS